MHRSATLIVNFVNIYACGKKCTHLTAAYILCWIFTTSIVTGGTSESISNWYVDARVNKKSMRMQVKMHLRRDTQMTDISVIFGFILQFYLKFPHRHCRRGNGSLYLLVLAPSLVQFRYQCLINSWKHTDSRTGRLPSDCKICASRFFFRYL